MKSQKSFKLYSPSLWTLTKTVLSSVLLSLPSHTYFPHQIYSRTFKLDKSKPFHSLRLCFCPCLCSLVVARQFESWDDVHGLQLLEQQLAGVRDSQRRNVAWRLTVVTPGNQMQTNQWLVNTAHLAVKLQSEESQ